MGADNLINFHKWDKWRDIALKCNILVFDRNNLQQVAPDNIYRAPQKLIYKTINKYIKITIDDTQSLTTNSANIIIPNIIGFDIYTIMGILNSQLYFCMLENYSFFRLSFLIVEKCVSHYHHLSYN